MSVLDRYRQQATLFTKAPSEIGDVLDLARIEAMRWKQIGQTIHEKGDPTALLGYAGLEVTPAIVNAPLVTTGATELLLWPAAGNTPIPINPQAPKFYRVWASGTSTTAATPGTYTINARAGTLITSPSVSGATGAITPVASATAAQWELQGWLYLRTGGTASVAVGSFVWNHSATVGGGGPATATSNAVFGGVSATFDTSTAVSGLVFGAIATTSTTNTFTPQLIAWGSWS